MSQESMGSHDGSKFALSFYYPPLLILVSQEMREIIGVKVTMKSGDLYLVVCPHDN